MKTRVSTFAAVFLFLSAPVYASEFDYICVFETDPSGFIPESATYRFDKNFEYVIVSDEIIKVTRKAPIKIKVTDQRRDAFQIRWQLDLPVTINEPSL